MDMGIAFEDIAIQPGIALFPALSVSKGQSVHVNFGQKELIYSIPGYSPLSIVSDHSAEINYLLDSLERLIPYQATLEGKNVSSLLNFPS